MLDIVMWPVDRPKDYPLNARKWSKKAIPKVRASLRAYGFRQPVVVDSEEVIIIGHLRRAAAREEGFKEIPVHVARDLTPAQVRGLLLADNRTSDESTWNEDLLRLDLAGLKDFDFDLGLTGFDIGEIGKFTRGEARPDEDDVPAVQEAVVSRRGDLWCLGDHRLLCGDATSAEDVERLMAGEAPVLMVTDPPYGVRLDSEWRDRAGINKAPAQASYMKRRIEGHSETTISGDDRADWSEAFALVSSLQVAYVWHASQFSAEVLMGLRRIGFTSWQSIIWAKKVPTFTHNHYWYQHEPCWYARKKNAPWIAKCGGEQTTIWTFVSPKQIMSGESGEEKFDHPTQKPAEVMRRPIRNHILEHGTVYDPFLGSGTTLIAAESESRSCFGLEIEPRYCDVIIRRWEKFTGKTAALGDGPYAGLTFDSVRESRLREAEDAIMEEALEVEAK